MILQNSPNRGFVDAKSGGKNPSVILVGDVITPDGSNLLPGKLSHIAFVPAVLSFPVWAATFAIHIVRIIFGSSKPKVGRVYTRSLVPVWAIMKHTRSFWRDLTEVNIPRSPVSQHHATGATPGDLAIPVAECSPDPNPTRLRNFNLAKEPAQKGIIKAEPRKQIYHTMYVTRYELMAQ